MNTLSGRSYHPALDEAVLQKQSAQVRLSTRSVAATPAIISRQETSPEETSGKQRGAGSKPRDIKKLLKDHIKAVSAKLEHAAIECRTCHDKGCNRGLIAFVESRTVLALCPPFFDSEIHKAHLTPRYLIHEAGHLAGVNTPTRDELYCHQEATKEDKCPVVDAIHNVDAWSHFIEDVASSI